MSSIWNVLGLSFIFVSTLTNDLLPETLPEIIMSLFDENELKYNRQDGHKQFLFMSTCFLAKAVQLKFTCSTYWANFALSLYKYSFHFLKDCTKFTETLNDATMAIKKALSLDENCPKLWNIYGAICHKLGKHALSQHCFIQSLKLKDVIEF